MDNKQNGKNLSVAEARLKRKMILRGKRANGSTSGIQNQHVPLQPKNAYHIARKEVVGKTRNFTPLSYISSIILNERDRINSRSSSIFNSNSNNIYTQPTVNQHPSQRKRRAICIDSLGVNLMNKFSEMNHDLYDEVNVRNPCKGTYYPAFQNSSTATSRRPLRPGRHLITNKGCISLEDAENRFGIDIDTNEGFTSDNHSTSDDEENNGYADPTESSNLIQGYSDIGDPIFQCEHCQAYLWYQERTQKHKNTPCPKYHLCCGGGKVQLPLLKSPPTILQHLLFDNDSVDSKNYQQHIRVYNMMFAFTSLGAKLDRSINNGRGPPYLRVQGQACHQIGSLLPMLGRTPKFAQLYIYDTKNEIQNRLQGLSNRHHVDPQIVGKLSAMLDQNNTHVKSFRMAKQRYEARVGHDLRLKLISDRTTDGRICNLPTVSEVAALIVGDVDTTSKRDIILEKQSGNLKRIDELHTSYLGLQYPLLFPFGEDGYRHDVTHRDSSISQSSKRNSLTIKEWFCFRLQTRENEAQTLLRSRILFQEFVVDGYTMMESERLSYIRTHQSQLRVDKYSNLNASGNQSQSQGSSKGKRIILPSTFVGGRRYKDQLYFDGMTICSFVGFPDLFLTFTCNPNWPEIQRVLTPMHLKPQDRPDILSRVFKIKFDELLKDLRKKEIFGKVLAYMYTIEFQKKGLPHAHLLIFLHPSNKYPSAEDIDKIISAEIPDQLQDKDL